DRRQFQCAATTTGMYGHNRQFKTTTAQLGSPLLVRDWCARCTVRIRRALSAGEALVAKVFISHTGADMRWPNSPWLSDDRHVAFLDRNRMTPSSVRRGNP